MAQECQGSATVARHPTANGSCVGTSGALNMGPLKIYGENGRTYGENMGNIWGKYGELMGKIWKTCGETHETYGKMIGTYGENMGKI